MTAVRRSVSDSSALASGSRPPCGTGSLLASVSPAVEWRPVAELREHPAAGVVPAMREEEFAAFLQDVGQRGILEPLHVNGAGFVLDGRHRLGAALELGLDSVPVRLASAEDEVEYMVRAAAQRRQLSPSQKAAMAVEFAAYQAERAHGIARQRANLRHQTVEVTNLTPRSGRARDRAAELLGVSSGYAHYAATLQRESPDLFQQVKAGTLNLNRAMSELKRARNYQAIGTAPPLPSGLFQLILADPPWQLGNPDSAYAPEQYYPTMPLEEIAALQIPAADDALLYLWAVNSHLPDALQVMAAWGFEYRGCEVWVKPSIGMGVWTRNRHEHLLIGRKGGASPAPRHLLLDSVIEAKRGRHSEKPTIIYQRLEHLYPQRSKLELFARGTPRPGWTTWGNQVAEEAA